MTSAAVPDQVQIMLTERCNLRCTHCAVPTEDSPADDELTTFEWFEVVDALAGAGLVDLTLSGGEVTLRRDTLAIAARAMAGGISRCTIVTNGVRFPDGFVAHLASLQADHPGLQLHVSLDGASSVTHDWIRGDGAFARTVAALHGLQACDGRIDGVHTVVHRGNRDELPAVANLARDLRARTWTVFPIASIGRGPGIADRSLDREGWHQVLQELPELAGAKDLELAVMGPVLVDDWPATSGDAIPRPRRERPDRLCVGPDAEAFACPPLRSRGFGNLANAVNQDRLDQVVEGLRLLLRAECASCRFLFLCTAVDHEAPLLIVGNEDHFNDPTPTSTPTFAPVTVRPTR